MTAWHLASQGRKILVLDTDFPCPSAHQEIIVSGHETSEYGSLDRLEDSGTPISEIIFQPEWSGNLSGKIEICPVTGEESNHHIGRYADLDLLQNPEYLEKLLEELESHLKPDIVLLDSPAGASHLAAQSVHLSDSYLILHSDTQAEWQMLESYFADLGNLNRPKPHTVAFVQSPDYESENPEGFERGNERSYRAQESGHPAPICHVRTRDSVRNGVFLHPDSTHSEVFASLARTVHRQIRMPG